MDRGTVNLMGSTPSEMNSSSSAVVAGLKGKRMSATSFRFWLVQRPFDVRIRTVPEVSLRFRAMLMSESRVTTNSVTSSFRMIWVSTCTLTLGMVVGVSLASELGGMIVVNGDDFLGANVVVEATVFSNATSNESGAALAEAKLTVAGTDAYSVHVPDLMTRSKPLNRSIVQTSVVALAYEI